MLINDTRRGLTESQARKIVLVRAFETPLAEPWTQADQAWASEETSRRVGENSPFDRWLAERADLASARISQRTSTVASALNASQGHEWLNWTLPLLAFASGLLADAVGSAQHINILSPPLLALMVWNLAVYALLAIASLRRTSQSGQAPSVGGPLRRGLAHVIDHAMQTFGKRVTAPATQAALAHFFADWMRLGKPLHAARITTLLHLSAAAITAGLLASLYVRGLAFEYRAGWDSTFLTPQNLHDLLMLVFGWATNLSGIALPDVAELAGLRFSVGPGENAARWIHLYAICVAVVVLLPRLTLAGAGASKSWRLRRQFSIDFDDLYFRRLRMAYSGTTVPVFVLPYSYQLTEEARAGLAATLTRGFGPGIKLTIEDSVPMGAEEEVAHWLPPPELSAEHHVIVLLFTLTATPERENHGTFIGSLKAAGASTAHLVVMVDESSFRKRFTGPQGARRLEQRSATWRRMLRELGQSPLFVNLADPDLDAVQAQLQPLQLPTQ